MTLNELVYDIKNLLKNGKGTDDDNLSKEQIAFWIRTVRSKLLRQEASKGYSVSDNVIQVLECVPLELVDASDCCDLELNCALLRTVDEIPAPVQGTSGDMVFSILGPNLRSIPVNQIPFERVPYWGSGRFTGKEPVIFDYNKRMYLISQYNPGRINIRGIWADPEEAGNFTNCNNEPCFTWDSPYPVSDHMADDIKKIILDTNFKALMSTTADIKNNNLDDSNIRN